MQRIKIIITLFIIGAIVGPTYDGFHSHSNTLFYPQVFFCKMAWWVPLLFGGASVAVGLSALAWDKRFPMHQEPDSWRHVVTGMGLFGLQYFASGFLKLTPLNMNIYLGLFALVNLIVLGFSLSNFFFCICVAIAGCLAEILISAKGLFFYTSPDIWGIPYWLPYLYVSAACSVGNTARKLAIS